MRGAGAGGGANCPRSLQRLGRPSGQGWQEITGCTADRATVAWPRSPSRQFAGGCIVMTMVPLKISSLMMKTNPSTKSTASGKRVSQISDRRPAVRCLVTQRFPLRWSIGRHQEREGQEDNEKTSHQENMTSEPAEYPSGEIRRDSCGGCVRDTYNREHDAVPAPGRSDPSRSSRAAVFAAGCAVGSVAGQAAGWVAGWAGPRSSLMAYCRGRAAGVVELVRLSVT
jgi:hypothetical protein